MLWFIIYLYICLLSFIYLFIILIFRYIPYINKHIKRYCKNIKIRKIFLFIFYLSIYLLVLFIKRRVHADGMSPRKAKPRIEQNNRSQRHASIYIDAISPLASLWRRIKGCQAQPQTSLISKSIKMWLTSRLTSRLSQVPEQHKAVNMGHQCCLVTGSTHAKEIKNT